MVRKNNGVTLVELLVALALSGILMAALYRVFIGGQRVCTVQEQVVDMQQNARTAMDRMTREIRMSGYRRDILASQGNIDGYTQVITPGDNVNNIGTYDDRITIIIADKAITYRLQWSHMDPGAPVLVREENGVAEVLADNIETLQFTYTLRNGATLDSPSSPDEIRMVKVSFTARTKAADPQLSGDGFRRRRLSSFATVRNTSS